MLRQQRDGHHSSVHETAHEWSIRSMASWSPRVDDISSMTVADVIRMIDPPGGSTCSKRHYHFPKFTAFLPFIGDESYTNENFCIFMFLCDMSAHSEWQVDRHDYAKTAFHKAMTSCIDAARYWPSSCHRVGTIRRPTGSTLALGFKVLPVGFNTLCTNCDMMIIVDRLIVEMKVNDVVRLGHFGSAS